MGSSAPPAAQPAVAADDGSAGLQARVDQASKALSDSLAASSGQNSTITTDQLLAEFKNHTQAVVAKSQAVMTQQLGETVHQLVERLDQSNQLQFGQQNQKLNTHNQAIAELQRLVAQLQTDINGGRAATSTERNGANAQAPAGRDDLGWDGAADPTLLR